MDEDETGSPATVPPPLQLVRDAYKACMHVTKIETLSVQYLKGILKIPIGDGDGPLKSRDWVPKPDIYGTRHYRR